MVKAATCVLRGQEIDIDEALRLRDRGGNRRDSAHDFRCVECDMPIRPHREGGHMEAHFEHYKRNPECRLSDPGR